MPRMTQPRPQTESPSLLPCRENSAQAKPSRGPVADVEIAIEGAEGDLAVCTATEGNVGFPPDQPLS